MILQRTVKHKIRLTGVGLHSGAPATVTIHPAGPDHGIGFKRVDVLNAPVIVAHYGNVINTQLATTIGEGRISVSTVEHLLSALYGAEIDNALIEVDGPEVPILDGSAGPFFEVIQKTGTVSQPVLRPYLMLRKRVELKVNEKWAFAEPSARLEIMGSIDWDHPAIGYQEFHYVSGKTAFSEIAHARTFGFLKDVEALKSMGLARGGSLDNAVVLDEARVLNPDGLRYPDELVRHKVLDALGDFKLAGIEIRAFVRMHRAGHDLHSQLLNAIFSNPDHFEVIEDAPHEESRVAAVGTALARRLAVSVS